MLSPREEQENSHEEAETEERDHDGFRRRGQRDTQEDDMKERKDTPLGRVEKRRPFCGGQ